MAREQTESKKNGSKKYDFAPVEYDSNKIEPEAAAGKYKSKVADLELTKTKNDGFPMIRLDWQLTKALTDDAACKKSEKATVSDWIVFFPDGNRKGNMGKRKFRQLRELLDLADDILPTRLESKSDFKELMAALKNAKAEIFISVKDDDNGEPRASVNYAAPKGMLADDDVDSDDDDDEEDEEDDSDEEDSDEEDEEDEDDDEDEEEDEPKKKSSKKRN